MSLQETSKKVLYFLILQLSLISMSNAQTSVTVSGLIKDKNTQSVLSFVNVVLKTEKDSAFVSGTVTNEEGRFSLSKIKSGNYYLEVSYIGYKTSKKSLFVGTLTEYLDIKNIEIEEKLTSLQEVLVAGKTAEINEKMDKKTFSLKDNISQSGGSVLQAMQNMPSVTVHDGKVQLRGNDKVTILIDGKQTALTGFGNQTGLDNIPASAIEKIEIINNPSAKYDANGNAGIINIIYKKNKKNGFNGKVGFTTGVGSLWVQKENLPTIRPQYTFTPKINPSVSLNYRKNKVNVFFQGDYLYTETLNKNEFVTRNYDNGDVINSQLKRNRNTHFTTLKSGFDYAINDQNSLTISGLFGSEKIIDRGDQPFFNNDFSQRNRLWQFLEDELKTTIMATASYQHKFAAAGHLLNIGFNYTFHREDEKYFYNNYLPTSTGTDAFKLLSDEQVYDFNFDYIKPLKYGRIETGIKFRNRNIPTNMQFIPGTNSVLDANAGGWATYKELIPAVYGNYIFENKKWEGELGLRIEYVKIQYDVNPNHIVYKSDGYNYTQPFPNLRLAYKISDNNKVSIFYNRRVDRPNEVDIRIFPKYDDAEIIKVGNPALRSQFTNSIELGYKKSWGKGSLYNAIYHQFADGTITRISSTVAPSNLIYATFQNVNKSYNTGVEMVLAQEISKLYAFNINLNAYKNQIDAFTVENKYPSTHTFSANKQEIFSGNLKINNTFHFPKNIDLQLTAIYLAPDIIPQGKIKSRFSLDFGLKKAIQKGKGELFFNATNLLNTMIMKKEINGQGFNYTSNDYYETQVLRLGYSYKF
ncbi:putative TonB-dependent outer membrane receptor [Flavobacterium psychrophilum]|uniref:outer membrane beta-barrel family protein n=1 Tax=Flavobacterium psychrophilum TaxID=96345 RepID=UPI000B7C1FC2|nr:outer membrane beta-barrel family protein [Flavobacterium psychrophilum]SNB18502.1 putative TonB-dependent outer membrane receptor [Flavobacterium psychrophilum]